MAEKIIEKPIVTFSSYGEPTMILHNYINRCGDTKMVLTKDKAALLFIELWKFLELEEVTSAQMEKVEAIYNN
jgi:hypothetical protein